jgi:hypothetical protein
LFCLLLEERVMWGICFVKYAVPRVSSFHLTKLHVYLRFPCVSFFSYEINN